MIVSQVLSSNFLIRATWESKKHSQQGGLRTTKFDNTRRIWFSGFGGISKHMKRIPDFWSNGRHQLHKQLGRTAKNGVTWTILNATQVQFHSVVKNTQDFYCEVGQKARVFCVIWQKTTQTRISWFRKKWKNDEFPKTSSWKVQWLNSQTKPRVNNIICKWQQPSQQ